MYFNIRNILPNSGRFLLGHPVYRIVPIPVVARSKVWVCGYSLDEITGSNPGGVVEVCLV
jgi:hypothetical protein